MHRRSEQLYLESFARPIKKYIQALGINKETDPILYRDLGQFMAHTRKLDGVDPYVFIHALLRRVDCSNWGFLVVDDIRYPEEANALHYHYRAFIVRVLRKPASSDTATADKHRLHDTEAHSSRIPVHLEVTNDSEPIIAAREIWAAAYNHFIKERKCDECLHPYRLVPT